MPMNKQTIRRPKLVLTQWVHQGCLDLLSQHADLITNQSKQALTEAQRLNYCQDADGMMVFMTDQIDDAFLSACPRLKFIAGALKGYDNINTEACRSNNTWLTICPDLLTEPTADLAIALLLGLTRNIPAGDQYIRQGGFQGWAPVFYGLGLQGSTVGILGMGKVGQSIARKLIAFGPDLIYHDLHPIDQTQETALSLTRASLEQVLCHSDHLILALPLNDQTHHLINADTLMSLKAGATLTNIGRGSVVDEAAIAESLDAGELAGYAADVFEFEDQSLEHRPRTIHPHLLENTANTLFTPHLGSAVTTVREAICMSAAQQLVHWLKGESPENVIVHGKPWQA